MAPPFPANFNIDYQKLAAGLDLLSNKPPQLFQAIVNAPFTEPVSMALLGLGIVMLGVVNQTTQAIDQIILSDTTLAKGATDFSMKRFEDIVLPLNQIDNLLVQAMVTGQPQDTSDWAPLFTPELTAEQARLNQASAGIGCSIVYPLGDAPYMGVLIFNYFQEPDEIVAIHHDFMWHYVTLVNQKLTDTGLI